MRSYGTREQRVGIIPAYEKVVVTDLPSISDGNSGGVKTNTLPAEPPKVAKKPGRPPKAEQNGAKK